MGLDLETMRPVRSIEGMSRMSFGEAASAIVRQCAESGDSEPFFRAWGMKESEIKLNRGGSGWRLTLDEESRPVVLDPEGRSVLATHAAFGSMRLTVLTGACAPSSDASPPPTSPARCSESLRRRLRPIRFQANGLRLQLMPCGRATWATLMNWPGPASGTCSSLRRIYAVRRSLTAVLALSLCSASALAADTLRIEHQGT